MENKITIQKAIDFFRARTASIRIPEGIDTSKQLIGGKNIFEATENHITFLSSKYQNNAVEFLRNTRSPIVIVDKSLETANSDKSILIAVDDAKKEISECLKYFFLENNSFQIEHTAILNEDSKIGNNVNVGHYSIIEDGVVVGDNSFIDSHVHIKKGTIIGSNVIIKSHSVIGNWGFGLNKREDGTYEAFPHFGNVIIEDDVQIGSSTCIDRGSLSDTIIRKGVKIDNLVHIAHNVEIGQNSVVIACCLIGGSTKVGKNCWLSPSVTLRNNIVIGDNVFVGMGAVVTKDLPSHSTVAGVPAMDLSDFKELMRIQKELIKGQED